VKEMIAQLSGWPGMLPKPTEFPVIAIAVIEDEVVCKEIQPSIKLAYVLGSALIQQIKSLKIEYGALNILLMDLRGQVEDVVSNTELTTQQT
jgi:hypothetical protein